MKAAVIGIGSNSVRVLLADVGEETFSRLWRDREAPRLFAGLDERGNLSRESMERTVKAVGRMTEEARARGAERVHIFATSAARDAANGQAFMAAVEEAAGVRLEIISGEEEAVLSYLGASCAVGRFDHCGVVDIGGGSTELISGTEWEIDCAFSCQMGAVRLFRQWAINGHEDMKVVEAAATSILNDNLRQHPEFTFPEIWVGTGGTFTSLASVARQVPWTDRSNMHGTRLSEAEIRGIGERLADMPLEERLAMPSLQPGRADIVVHGICILLAVMNRLGIERIMVSEWGNLDGYFRWEYYCKKEKDDAVRTER